MKKSYTTLIVNLLLFLANTLIFLARAPQDFQSMNINSISAIAMQAAAALFLLVVSWKIFYGEVLRISK
jgi:drug/metabolite transporter (DMT)-like permease